MNKKMSIKIKYKNEIFPKILHSEEDYEIQEVIIPEASGDYFLCRISSAGEYDLIDYIGADEVTIIIDQPKLRESRKPSGE